MDNTLICKGISKETKDWVVGYYFLQIIDEKVIPTIQVINVNEYGLIIGATNHPIIFETRCKCTECYDNTTWKELTEDEKRAWRSNYKTKVDWQGKLIFDGDIVIDIKGDTYMVVWNSENCKYTLRKTYSSKYCKYILKKDNPDDNLDMNNWKKVVESACDSYLGYFSDENK